MKDMSIAPFLVTLAKGRRVTRRPLVKRDRKLLGLIAIVAATVALSLSLSVRAQSPTHSSPGVQTATGQYIAPTAQRGSLQQFLNPNLPAYPNFVAGEAVRSQLSPDGKTLAILCAGQNSLVSPDGKNDVAASTQFIFLY